MLALALLVEKDMGFHGILLTNRLAYSALILIFTVKSNIRRAWILMLDYFIMWKSQFRAIGLRFGCLGKCQFSKKLCYKKVILTHF